MEKEFSIVDVRTRAEFSGGHVAGSVNIPLQELIEREDELHQLKQPILFCCASGIRSGQAHTYFKNRGFECENAGSWMDVNFKLSN